MGFGIRQRSTTPLLSAAQLQELLQTVEEGGADQGGEAVSAQDVGLEDLSTSELRALLQSLEG